ncbi:MAG: hypothetical protein P4M05_28230 [Bradyrhizobium sp.]|nr:hypothetical protein [Bradyrhizobium sp.]
MDPKLIRDAIDAAFHAHVASLFNVAIDGIVSHDQDAQKRFVTAIQRAYYLRDDTLARFSPVPEVNRAK